MKAVTEHQIVSEMYPYGKKGCVANRKVMYFILERYFHYSFQTLVTGRIMSFIKKFAFQLEYIEYGKVHNDQKNMLLYSSRIFGLALLPVVKNKRFIKKFGYVYKPNKYVLNQIKPVMDSDDIYTLMKKS